MNATTNICAICLDNLLGTAEEAKNEQRLDCSHIFHRQCIASWFDVQPSCPTCRAHTGSTQETLNSHNLAAREFSHNPNLENQALQNCIQASLRLLNHSHQQGIDLVIPLGNLLSTKENEKGEILI